MILTSPLKDFTLKSISELIKYGTVDIFLTQGNTLESRRELKSWCSLLLLNEHRINTDNNVSAQTLRQIEDMYKTMKKLKEASI